MLAVSAILAVGAVSTVLAVQAVCTVLTVHAVHAVDVAILIGNWFGVGGSVLVFHGFFLLLESGRSLAQMMDYTRKHSRKRLYTPM